MQWGFPIRCGGRYLCVQLSCWTIEPRYRYQVCCNVYVGRRVLEHRIPFVWPQIQHTKCSEKHLSQWHFVHPKSHIASCGIKPEPPQWHRLATNCLSDACMTQLRWYLKVQLIWIIHKCSVLTSQKAQDKFELIQIRDVQEIYLFRKTMQCLPSGVILIYLTLIELANRRVYLEEHVCHLWQELVICGNCTWITAAVQSTRLVMALYNR
jgi:hypothetical protein